MRTSFLLLSLGLAAALPACGREKPDANQQLPTGAVRPIEAKTVTASLSARRRRAPSPDRMLSVRPGEQVEWSYMKHPLTVGYKMGDMTVIVGPAEPVAGYSGLPFDWVIRQIRIQAAGRMNDVFEDDIGVGFKTRLTYGRLDRAGTRFLLTQTDTGGNHCTDLVELFVLYAKGTERMELGTCSEFDFDTLRDFDGDGTVDFIRTEGAFVNHFTPWVDGREPPIILNVVDGEVRDVSTRPEFRPLFARAARELRKECLHPDGMSPNGACAAYVAAAGRAGNFRKAWAEMLVAYDRDNKEGLECRLHMPDNSCPPNELKYATYPEALRAFLREQGFPAG